MREKRAGHHAEDPYRAAVHRRAPVHPGQRRPPRLPRSSPRSPRDDLKRLYRGMLLGRRLDERMLRLQRQGRIGTFAPIKGQEAAQIGSVSALRAHRLDGALLPRDGRHALAGLADREAPAALRRLPRGRPARARAARPAGHASRSPPSCRTPSGLAYAAQYRGDDAVVMAYCGDGATSEGDFHEAMNFAGVWHVPVVFLCQNNQWAISVPLKKQTALAHHRPEGARLRASRACRSTATTCSRSTRRCREAVERARARRRADAGRVRDLPAGRAHHRRRSDQVPLDRGGGGVGAQGSAHALRRLPAEEGVSSSAAWTSRSTRRSRAAVQRFEATGAARPARDVRPRLRHAAAQLEAQRAELQRASPGARRRRAAGRAARQRGAAAAPADATRSSPPMRGQRRAWPS